MKKQGGDTLWIGTVEVGGMLLIVISRRKPKGQKKGRDSVR